MSGLRKALNNAYEKADEIRHYSVEEEYNRKLYEDKKAMKKCVQDFFGNEKIKKDPLTGNILHKDGKAADRKYGKRCATRHKAHPDHDDPLEKIHSRHNKTKYIKNDDIRTVGNRRSNLIAKQAKLNMSKNSDYNKEAAHNSQKQYGKELKNGAKIVEVVRGEKNKIETDAILYSKSVKRALFVKTVDGIEKINDAVAFFNSEEIKLLHQAGVDEAVGSAMFAATLSVTKNTIAVAKGEEDINEAVKDVLIDISAAAVLGYATGTVKDVIGLENHLARLLFNGTVQVTKQMVAYVNGDIDETKLINNIAETSVMLAAAYAGKLIGAQLIPIPYVGPYIGEMFTTAICSELISVIKETKEFERHNKKIISLYHRAEKEIKVSNLRLSEIVEFENNELKQAIDDGFSNIYKEINMNSYDDLLQGLFIIGSRFGMTEDNFREGTVTKENLFKNVDNVRVIGKRV